MATRKTGTGYGTGYGTGTPRAKATPIVITPPRKPGPMGGGGGRKGPKTSPGRTRK